MARNLINQQAKFGTPEVFTTSVSTILGAILFLRFGYAVGNVGFLGALGIIGHYATIQTLTEYSYLLLLVGFLVLAAGTTFREI